LLYFHEVMMKRLVYASLVVLPCLLSAAAFADQTAASADSAVAPASTSTPRTSLSNAPSDRGEYLQKVHAEMHDWRVKLKRFDREAAAKTEKVGADAKRDIRVAWAETKVQSRHLEKAGAEGWDRARQGFEEASEHLQESWDRATSKSH
jgi:hypothetical protein